MQLTDLISFKFRISFNTKQIQQWTIVVLSPVRPQGAHAHVSLILSTFGWEKRPRILYVKATTFRPRRQLLLVNFTRYVILVRKAPSTIKGILLSPIHVSIATKVSILYRASTITILTDLLKSFPPVIKPINIIQIQSLPPKSSALFK